MPEQGAHQDGITPADGASGCRSFRPAAYPASLRSPCLCDPGNTRSGPSLSPQSSRWTRTASILAITSAGGRTWSTPSFVDHGPQPGTSLCSRTAMAQS